MKAFKGFNKDLSCRGFKYKKGETYKTDKAELCQCGFHACVSPLDCFSYYSPNHSIYYEVELKDTVANEDSDSKICGKAITIGEELYIEDIIEYQIDYVRNNAKDEVKMSESNYIIEGKSKYSIIDYPDCSKSIVAVTNKSSVAEIYTTCSVAAATNAFSIALTKGAHSSAITTEINSIASCWNDYSIANCTNMKSMAYTTARHSVSVCTDVLSKAVTTEHHSVAACTNLGSNATCECSDSIAACTKGDKATTYHSNSIAANTGYNGVIALCNGNNSIAATTQNKTYSTTSGKDSVAVSTGISGNAYTKGTNSVAIASGFKGKAKAEIGSAICLCERGEYDKDTNSYPIKAIKAAIVDGEILKANTWYRLENGEFVEVAEKSD